MFILIKNTFVISFFCLTFISYSQSNITEKVIESSTNVSLGEIFITNIRSKKRNTSNLNGAFKVSEAGLYNFTKVGYAEKTLELKADNYYVIQLKTKPSILNEIIVTANHIPKALNNILITEEDVKKQAVLFLYA